MTEAARRRRLAAAGGAGALSQALIPVPGREAAGAVRTVHKEPHPHPPAPREKVVGRSPLRGRADDGVDEHIVTDCPRHDPFIDTGR